MTALLKFEKNESATPGGLHYEGVAYRHAAGLWARKLLIAAVLLAAFVSSLSLRAHRARYTAKP